MRSTLIPLCLACLFLCTRVFGVESQQSVQLEDQVKGRAYNFGLGLAHIAAIGNEYNHYEKLFGSPSIYPEIWGEYSPLHLGWGFEVSLGIHLGIYRDTGKSVRRTDDLEISSGGLGRDIRDDEIDPSQKSVLTLIPVQGVVSLGYTPFNSRFIVANVWSGIGFTYVENTTKAALSTDIDQSDVKPYINSGWNREKVTGASISFDLSGISAWDTYSLKVHGIEAIYITPYYQTVTTIKNKVGKYDRRMMGLMFTFETRR